MKEEQQMFDGIPMSETKLVKLNGTGKVETDVKLALFERVTVTLHGFVSHKTVGGKDPAEGADTLHVIQAEEIIVEAAS